MAVIIATVGFTLLILGRVLVSATPTPQRTWSTVDLPTTWSRLENEHELTIRNVIATTPSSTSATDSSNDGRVVGDSGWDWQPITWEWWLIPQMIVAMLGIWGNVLVIFVLFVRRNQSRSTDTLIGALAAADFLTSVFLIPLPSPARVPQTILGEAYCRILFQSMPFWICIDASILTLTVIPIERFFAIVYPLHFKRWMTRRVVSTCIVIIWVVSVLANLFVPFIGRVSPAISHCSVEYPFQAMQVVNGYALFAGLFAIPALLMLVMQALTARALHVQSRINFGANNSSQSEPTSPHNVAKWRVIQMLLIVVLIFIICWGPSATSLLLYNLKYLSDSFLDSPLDRVLVLISFCNSCANPIIYTARYPQFRSALRGIFISTKRTNAPVFELEGKSSASAVAGEASRAV